MSKFDFYQETSEIFPKFLSQNKKEKKSFLGNIKPFVKKILTILMFLFSELELAMRRNSPKKAVTKLSVKNPSNRYHCPKKDQTQQKILKISTLEVWQVLADWKVMWNVRVLLRDLPLKRKKLKVRWSFLTDYNYFLHLLRVKLVVEFSAF